MVIHLFFFFFLQSIGVKNEHIEDWSRDQEGMENLVQDLSSSNNNQCTINKLNKAKREVNSIFSLNSKSKVHQNTSEKFINNESKIYKYENTEEIFPQKHANFCEIQNEGFNKKEWLN